MGTFGIVPRNGNLNNKALEVSQELLKVYKEEKLDYIDDKNISPGTHLNKSRLHFNRNGSIIICKNFVSFVSKYFS